MIIISSTFAQALTGNSGGARIIGVLIVFCFITGVGISSDYLLSVVITCKFSPTQICGHSMTSVFTTRGWGNFSAFHYHLNMVYFHINLLCSCCFGSIYHCQCLQEWTSWGLTWPGQPYQLHVAHDHWSGMCFRSHCSILLVDDPWDALFHYGYWTQCLTGWERHPDWDGQWSVVNSNDIIQHVQGPQVSLSDFRAYFSQWQNLKNLIGTSYSWFALDVHATLQLPLCARV